eukprot:tig00000189_g14330.t1
MKVAPLQVPADANVHVHVAARALRDGGARPAPVDPLYNRTGASTIAISMPTDPESADEINAVVVIDSQCRMLAVNERAEALLGYREADLLGRNVSALMPKGVAAEHDGYVARFLRSGRAKVAGASRDVMALTAAGEEIPCELSLRRARRRPAPARPAP